MTNPQVAKLEALAAQIKALREQNKPAQQNKLFSAQRALFLGTFDDVPALPFLKPYFKDWHCETIVKPVETIMQLAMICQQLKITKVVSTSPTILKKLVEMEGSSPNAKPSINNYAGSVFTFSGIEIVFVFPLQQLFTVPYGKFLAERFISKVLYPEKWADATPFTWEILTSSNVHAAYQQLQSALAIATDIETLRAGLAIDCISFTGIFCDGVGKLTTRTYVLELRDEWSLSWMRKFCQLPPDKIFQNGKYDNIYLLRFNSPCVNWIWDTSNFFHSWYAELPKDLGFQNAFFVRKVIYWKDLAETPDRKEYLRYNAMDTWATANVWIQQMLTAPDWVKHNYFLEFPVNYPSLLCELTGIDRDMERLSLQRDKVWGKEERLLGQLQRMLGCPNFNPSSHVQVKALLSILGCSDLADSSDETNLQAASIRHPLNAVIFGVILEIRGLKKLRTTYLRTELEITKTSKRGGKEFKGKILYSISPDGTETGRNASRESAFWCGLQIQNIPQGKEVKCTLMAPTGFYMAEVDLEQAESRDTAFISGDKNLIEAVSDTEGDFHSYNASKFFGIPYEKIYDRATGKVLDKKMRTLSKPINHGANYNMGKDVMIDNMTIPLVWEAKRLLNLPFTQLAQITEYLLVKFHLTYPTLKGLTKISSREVRDHLRLPDITFKNYAPNTYYAYVANSVKLTSKLVSRAFHHTEYNLRHWPSEADQKQYIKRGDWSRFCFGNPDTNKRVLNSYVAHCPQSLNARTLNEAFLEVFYKVALPNPTTFRLLAQIHDSILHAFREGHHHHAEEVRQCMEIPVTVQDISGNYRTFTVPAAIKAGPNGKGVKYWSDTE